MKRLRNPAESDETPAESEELRKTPEKIGIRSEQLQVDRDIGVQFGPQSEQERVEPRSLVLEVVDPGVVSRAETDHFVSVTDISPVRAMVRLLLWQITHALSSLPMTKSRYAPERRLDDAAPHDGELPGAARPLHARLSCRNCRSTATLG